jgi:ketosteroid isomerase-like protein
LQDKLLFFGFKHWTTTMINTSHDLALVFFQALNTRDFDSAKKFLHEDVALDFPGSGRMEGIRRVIIFIKALLRKYPVLIFNIREVIVEGDRICAIWTNTGENLAGDDYENSGITLFHLENQQIIFISDYFKDTSFTT